MCEAKNNKEDTIEDDSSSGSDVSMTDEESENEDIVELSESELVEEDPVDEEEDEVIVAIRRANNQVRDHPPPIQLEHHVMDICFHPEENIIAAGNVIGDVVLYRYTNEENTLIDTLELHTKSCRDIEFSNDGKILFSTAADKSIMLSDVETKKLMRFYENSHDASISCLTIIDGNIFATGDDDGSLKLWDLRIGSEQQIFKAKRNEDYISDIITNEAKKYLLTSSGDGSLTTFDLQNRKFFMQSEEYDEELTCLGLFRTETKVLAGSSKGKLFLYNWNEFGLHSDEFPGPKVAINSLIPITENIVVTACEDGNLRATHLFPHRHLGVVGQHQLSVENLDICNTGQFIASSSHNNDIKFWNIQYFEEFEKVSRKHKKHETKKELAHNLPSSKIRNAADFFSDM